MALIAQYITNQPVAGYYLRVDIYLDSQSIVANTSYGHTDVLAVAGGGKYDSDGTSWAVQTDGEGTSGVRAADFSGGSFWLALGAAWNAVHNPDGSKAISSSVVWNGASGGWFGFSGASGAIGLTTIPRATVPTLSAPSVDAGGSVTINLPRASAGFTHTITYDFVGLSGQTSGIADSATAGASTTLVPPLALMNQMPAATSATAIIRVKTWSGATQIGSEQAVALIVSVPIDVKPTIGGLTAVEATTAPAVATLIGKFVQGVSRLTVNATGLAGSYSSTIDAAKTTITVAGQTISAASGTTGVIALSGNLTVLATVTDSRGRTNTFSIVVNVLAYAPPVIDPTTVLMSRVTAGGSPMEEGTTLKIAFSAAATSLPNAGTEMNAVKYRLMSRANGASVYTEVIGVTTPGGLVFNSSRLIATYAIDASWDILIEARDALYTSTNVTTAGRTVPTSKVFQHWNGSAGMGVLKYHEHGALDVGGDIYQSGLPVVDWGDSASASLPGLAQIATDAEVIGATVSPNNSKFVTPGSLQRRMVLSQDLFSQATAATSFPVGTSLMLHSPGAGWPVNTYGIVRTERGYNDINGYGTIQYWNSYFGMGSGGDAHGLWFREWGYAAVAWGAWRRLKVAGFVGDSFVEAAGKVTAATNTTGNTTITLPSGRFSVPPVVSITPTSVALNLGIRADPSATSLYVQTFSTASGDPISGVAFDWTAKQMTSSAAAG